MILTSTYYIYYSCLPFGFCSALVSGIYLFCREKDRSPKTRHQICARENDPHSLLSQNLALYKNGYLLMPAMLHAKISRKSCALRKRNKIRNKSMSLTTRRRSSSDSISFFGPNGSRCNRLRGRRKVAVVSICLTEFPKQQYKLDYNLAFFFLDVQTIPL